VEDLRDSERALYSIEEASMIAASLMVEHPSLEDWI
jgi:hypothetical protein